MKPPRIGRLLEDDGEIQPVVAKAREIHALAKLCKEFLPSDLTPHVHPANFQGGKLVVLAANSAAAAKLRLLSESLGDFLSKRGAKVNSVSVKVQPAASEDPVAEDARGTTLSPQAFAILSELYGSLEESPAREALKQLLAAEAERETR